MAALQVKRIEVGPETIEVTVRVADPASARTSGFPGLPDRALELLPGLSRHSCENGSAHGYIAELADTETPHLLEHVTCELMALSGSPRTLRAQTSWDFRLDGPGVFRMEFAYDDDLVCLGALRNGVDVVQWLLDPSTDRPNVDRVVAELAVVRGRAV